VRALGAHIKGTNGSSQGIVPFLKVANDAAIAVNQGGKRAGAVCAYLESWHLDLEEFLELRKNTGDERRRTHDMHTANWIPDLFMQRVAAGGQWTLFSPDDVPDLHELYGCAFNERYEAYEAAADRGEIRLFKRVAAVELWRKMLSALFETGHPWLTWKDPANARSPQDHVGVVHGSNLCTEILLNTSTDETAVCNLGSVNLGAHMRDGRLDEALLRETVTTAVRMLDNVIDVNFYPTPEARAANLRHRPVGLGVMGWQDALYALGIGAASEAALDFADTSAELIAHAAIGASADLARERGRYASYGGSKWDRGLLPQDTLDLLEQERGEPVEVERGGRLDWAPVRVAVRAHGMRNSNVMAIAPTATISNIAGASQSIEPTYQNLYVKSNLSGDFVQMNAHLVADLKRLGLWDAEMRDDLKYFDGSVQQIPRIPDELKERYRTAFEIEPRWVIGAAARRQKWIEQGQSLNLYLAEPSGRKLSEMYMAAWRAGLKTTYYLRTLAATQIEKSTLDVNRRGIQPRWMKSASPSGTVVVERSDLPDGAACGLDADCEACQ
jgi:ribonucleoside-diphosphate reductase alpha chain